MISIRKELGLKLQETTQQVVKEMSTLLHTFLSQFSGFTVLAHQVLLPEGISFPIPREVIATICQGHSTPLLLVPDVTMLSRHYHETFAIFPLCGEWFLSVGRLLSVEFANSGRLSLSHVGQVECIQDKRRLPTSSFYAS